MEEDFDTWSKLKRELNGLSIDRFTHPREFWWCSLGINVGVEIDGKNENFECPVIYCIKSL